MSDADYTKAASEYADRPLEYVHWAWPWGEGKLKDETGPDTWQTRVLHKMGKLLQSGDTEGALKIAVKSGHGPGKTALVSWVIHWFMATKPNCAITVTAGTENQLKNRTWRELNKWNQLAINGHLFNWTKTRFEHISNPETWFAAAVPWSESNPDAFAGLHEKHVMLIFDEASAIHHTIWEVSEGAMTTKGAIWIAFGNPTNNQGEFRACFGSKKHRWIRWTVDSREAKKANLQQIEQWKEDYGEDSDFFRVRVKGEFPRQGSTQFISSDAIAAAVERDTEINLYAPVIMGVDVARYGGDQSVICRRQGNKVYGDIYRYRETSGVELARIVADKYSDPTRQRPQIIAVDGVGVGASVVDHLNMMGLPVFDVQAGARATDHTSFTNLRAEMWSRLKDAMFYLDIPDDRELKEDLESAQYKFDKRGRLQMMSKDDMKKLGYASPDTAESVALTYAINTVIPTNESDLYPEEVETY